MNDGNGGTTFTIQDDSAIRNKPYLSQHQLTGLSNTGNDHVFKLVAINEIGQIESKEISFVLASVPDAPTAIPT